MTKAEAERAMTGFAFKDAEYRGVCSEDRLHRVYAPWQWVIGTGVLVSDVEQNAAMTRKALVWLGCVTALLVLTAVLVTRSIVGPLGWLTGSLEQLAASAIDADGA